MDSFILNKTSKSLTKRRTKSFFIRKSLKKSKEKSTGRKKSVILLTGYATEPKRSNMC